MELEQGQARAVQNALDALINSEWSQAGCDWNTGRHAGLILAKEIFEAVYQYELAEEVTPKHSKHTKEV